MNSVSLLDPWHFVGKAIPSKVRLKKVLHGFVSLPFRCKSQYWHVNKNIKIWVSNDIVVKIHTYHYRSSDKDFHWVFFWWLLHVIKGAWDQCGGKSTALYKMVCATLRTWLTDIPVLLQTYPDSHKMYPQRCLSKYTSFLGGNANFKPNLSLYLIGLDAGGMRFNSPLWGTFFKFKQAERQEFDALLWGVHSDMQEPLSAITMMEIRPL